ncbi:FAD-dependent oxidoreductase [Neobacillus sp. MER 74]|uniref:FAD-dependent oxidoreductase n=1 Tax=Neobacillus sp. MER 74 TaxID=2939566 RepID=UPI00203C4BF3|nr:FAD-dependent oxidoreductase [Neobacillus sp. MER 74]MCM3115047.1 FAD-dependent oxidoreductase [Neobacillus sp. MER 74]
MTNHRLPAQEIPILAEVDVVIIGGSFAGLSSALQLAKQGKRVMVVESRTYLGSELTAALRPWITMPHTTMPIPRILEACVKACGRTISNRDSQSIVFHVDRLKLQLEEELLGAGIHLLYASLPIGITNLADNYNGLIIANKSGRQLIRCQGIVDASETAITTFFNGEVWTSSEKSKTGYFKRVLEFTNVQEIDEIEFTVPSGLGIKHNKIHLYSGYHGNGHFYVEYEMLLPADNSLEANQQRELAAQKAGMSLAEYLVHHIPAFNKALLCASSYELKGPFQEMEEYPKTQRPLNLDQLSVNYPNTWCFYQDLYKHGNTDWLDPVKAAALGEQVAELLNDLTFKKENSGQIKAQVSIRDDCFEMKIPVDLLDCHVNQQFVPEQEIYLCKTAGVLVAGGGSSGASAAIVSAEEGINTILVDLNPGLGGTGTFGGVDSYWFGKRHGYAERITKLVHDVQKRIKYKGHKWNIEAKKFALIETADRLGIEWLFNTITFGAITKGTRVCGSLVATKWGAGTVWSDCVIDATGDGDLAAFSGAEFEYGSVRDHVVMWYSLAQYKEPGKLQNNFTSMVNVSDVQDYTRAILAGRRRWSADVDGCHDHGIYVAPRESRHIIGDVVMNMSDQLLHRSWTDCINIHFSNHDMKGISEADWLNAGLIPPNLEIEIPYRMLLPKGLDGILVVGKAFSATHDALPAIRMQSDLENLGGIAALAAAMAVKEKQYPRQIDYRLLQERIIKEGLMPESILTRKLGSIQYTDEELKSLVDSIEIEPLYEYSHMRMNEIYQQRIPFVEICTAGERIIPYLEQAYAGTDGIKKVRIAQALAMYGSKSGVPTLIHEINAMLQGEELPKRTADILYVTMPPDHGAMSDACYLLYSLGLTRDKRSIKVWQRVADLLQPTEEDFKDKLWGIFYYIHAICVGAERLGDVDAIPMLEQLLRIPSVNNQQCYAGHQADFFLERRALLELAIGRALARCGSAKGYEILVNYLDDVRSLLSKQAHTELKRLSASNLSKDKRIWSEWLEREKARLKPQPYIVHTDIGVDNEKILRKITFERG